MMRQQGPTSTHQIAARLARETSVQATDTRPISHNSSAQRVTLAGNLILSTGNLLQLALLLSITPNAQYYSTFREAQLNQLLSDQHLLEYTRNIANIMRAPSNNRDRSVLRTPLRRFYGAAAAAAAGSMPPPDDYNEDLAAAFSSGGAGGNGVPPNDDELALKIANEIAIIYYENLELTLEDVQGVIKNNFPQQEDLQRIDDKFIEKIVHTRIDKGRYELLTLLPDRDFIKVAVDKLKNVSFFKKIANEISNWWNGIKQPVSPLQSYKDNINQVFNKYISWWKFSWFGHHHDERARVVKARIQGSQNVEEIKAILTGQIMIMRDESGPLPTTSWQDSRWNDRNALKNIPTNPGTSGYCKVLDEALKIDPPRL